MIGSGLVLEVGEAGPFVAAAYALGDDPAGSVGAHHRLNRDKTAHLPAYLERNMLAPRHWNPPGA